MKDFAQMTERALQVCARGCVQVVEWRLSEGILSGLEIGQKTFHNYLVFDQGMRGLRPGRGLARHLLQCRWRARGFARLRSSRHFAPMFGIMDQVLLRRGGRFRRLVVVVAGVATSTNMDFSDPRSSTSVPEDGGTARSARRGRCKGARASCPAASQEG